MSKLLTFDREEGVCFGCGGDAKPGMLMCWPDWKRVPKRIQRAVWKSNYRSHPHHEQARLAARVAVAVKEGLPASPAALALLESYGVGPDGYPSHGGGEGVTHPYCPNCYDMPGPCPRCNPGGGAG